MAWEAVSAISSIIGTVAVIGTVIYLAIQVKRSTQATYSQTYQFATLKTNISSSPISGSACSGGTRMRTSSTRPA